MARRRSARKTTTRRSKSVNVLGTAESIILANAVTQGLFNTNLFQFVTGRTKPGQFAAGADGATVISLPELAGFTSSGWSADNVGGRYTGSSAAPNLAGALKYNFSKNGATMIATLIATPIAFRIGSKLLAKPRREANKLLKMSGIGSMVKV